MKCELEHKGIKTLQERIRRHKRMTIVDNIKMLTSQFILKKPGLSKKILRKQGKKATNKLQQEKKKKKKDSE